MSTYYPPYKSSGQNVKVELDLTNYETKTDLKNITHVDVSSYASKTNLAALKSEVDKIDVYKLKTTPTDLAKLSNVVKNLEQCKLLKMLLIIQTIIIKDMVYVLIKEVSLVIQ